VKERGKDYPWGFVLASSLKVQLQDLEVKIYKMVAAWNLCDLRFAVVGYLKDNWG